MMGSSRTFFSTYDHVLLHQVHAELLEGLQQPGVLDLDNENTLWGLTPRQPLAVRVLDVRDDLGFLQHSGL